MKFRTDFITNSSSSSFAIVTAKLKSKSWDEMILFETDDNEETLREHLATLNHLNSKFIYSIKTTDELISLLIPKTDIEDSDFCYVDYNVMRENIRKSIPDMSDLHYIEIALCKTLWGEFTPIEFAALYDDVCTHSNILRIDYKSHRRKEWQEGYEYLYEYKEKFDKRNEDGSGNTD